MCHKEPGERISNKKQKTKKQNTRKDREEAQRSPGQRMGVRDSLAHNKSGQPCRYLFGIVLALAFATARGPCRHGFLELSPAASALRTPSSSSCSQLHLRLSSLSAPFPHNHLRAHDSRLIAAIFFFFSSSFSLSLSTRPAISGNRRLWHSRHAGPMGQPMGH